MAKIMIEQLKKWNAQAKNGFQFDLRYFRLWHEKTLTKKIKMENGDVIEFKIEYCKEFETKTNEYGCKWNVETGRYIPMLYIRCWKLSTVDEGKRKFSEARKILKSTMYSANSPKRSILMNI